MRADSNLAGENKTQGAAGSKGDAPALEEQQVMEVLQELGYDVDLDYVAGVMTFFGGGMLDLSELELLLGCLSAADGQASPELRLHSAAEEIAAGATDGAALAAVEAELPEVRPGAPRESTGGWWLACGGCSGRCSGQPPATASAI